MRNLFRYLNVPEGAERDAFTITVTGFLVALKLSWAVLAGTAVLAATHSTLIGLAVFLVLAAGFNLRWQSIGKGNGGVNLAASLIVGGVSSAVLGWLIFGGVEPSIAIPIGWVVTGMLNVSFLNWFWGNPMVFESREFSSVFAFLSGPIYWAGWLSFLTLAVICEGLGKLVSMARTNNKSRQNA